MWAGRQSDAISLLEQIVEDRTAQLGSDNPETLARESLLAEAYRMDGRWAESLPQLKEVLEKQRTICGPTNDSTLQTMHNLAMNYAEVGQFPESIELHEKVLTARRSTRVPEHPSVTWCLRTFAQVCQRAGQLDRADKLLREALELERKREDSLSRRDGGANYIERYGPASLAAFSVALDGPNASPVTVDFTTASGSAISGNDFASTADTLTFAPGQTTQTILVPTLNDAADRRTKTFTVNLSNPVGGVITDGQGIGTILDDEPSFTWYDGGTSDRTYQYGTAGSARLGATLLVAATRPRAASPAPPAGTTDWVVDANKNVYVYSTGGTLLGSWSAGGIGPPTPLTGITTNGTDIWLVDSQADKV